MRLGINYPWLHCGWDFGSPPPGFGVRDPELHEVRTDLARLARVGVSIVRWFVLADGLVYGTSADAPRREKSGFRFVARAPLEHAFLDDFVKLLALCRELKIQLLPVLLDHQFAFPGLDRHSTDARTLAVWDRSPRAQTSQALRLLSMRERASRLPEAYVKGGRGDVLRGELESERFFEHVLMPLLRASQAYAEQIYAWELINEPEWVTRGALELGWRIPKASMLRFLQRGLSVIREHGFVSTVGFARARTLSAWQTALPALGLNQIHYYPRFPWSRLPSAQFRNGLPTLLGEFATRSGPLRGWPELVASEQDIASRLALARRRGYQAALLWSYRGRDRATEPAREKIETALLGLRPDAISRT